MILIKLLFQNVNSFNSLISREIIVNFIALLECLIDIGFYMSGDYYLMVRLTN